jgi:hypothetical protein
MPTIDCFRNPPTGELNVIVTGAEAAPVVTNLDGAMAVLEPAVIDGNPWFSSVRSGDTQAGSWWGDVRSDPDASQVRLAVAIDGRCAP